VAESTFLADLRDWANKVAYFQSRFTVSAAAGAYGSVTVTVIPGWVYCIYEVRFDDIILDVWDFRLTIDGRTVFNDRIGVKNYPVISLTPRPFCTDRYTRWQLNNDSVSRTLKGSVCYVRLPRDYYDQLLKEVGISP